MNQELLKLKIDGQSINDDFYGKKGAQYELDLIAKELKIAQLKVVGICSMFVVPTLILAPIVALMVYIGNGSYEEIIASFIVTAVLSGVFSALGTNVVFFGLGEIGKDERGEPIYGTKNGPNPYKDQIEKISELKDRQKKLLRYLNVESEHYEGSQARDMAPLLVARINKYNFMIDQGSKMIELQRTLEDGVAEGRADQLESSLIEKVKKDHSEINKLIQTYEVLKGMPADTPLAVTASLMKMEDLNKSDLKLFLSDTEEALALLMEDNDNNLPVS